MIRRFALLVLLSIATAGCSRGADGQGARLGALAAQLAAQSQTQGALGVDPEDGPMDPAALSPEASAREELLTAYAAALRASRGLTPPADATSPARRSTVVPATAPEGVTPEVEAAPAKPLDPAEDEQAIRELYLTAYQATFRSADEAATQRLDKLKRRMDDHRAFVRAWTKKHPEQPAVPESVAKPEAPFPAPLRAVSAEDQ